MTNFFLRLFSASAGAKPLFASQRELARLLCAKRGTVDEQQVRNTSAFISQMVNGTRPLPESWKNSLRVIIERRAHERDLPPADFVVLMEPSERRENFRPLDVLIYTQRSAHDVLILNACPLELTASATEHLEAATLQGLVVDALQAGRRYHYGVANRATASRLWQVLTHAAQKLGPDTVRRWIGTGSLQISVVPELLLLHPTVAYNTGLPDRLSAFVWHAPYDWDHCLELPERQVANWLGNVRGALDTHAEPISFPH